MLLVVQIRARFRRWHSRSFQTLGRARERLTRASTRKVPAWLPPRGFRAAVSYVIASVALVVPSREKQKTTACRIANFSVWFVFPGQLVAQFDSWQVIPRCLVPRGVVTPLPDVKPCFRPGLQHDKIPFAWCCSVSALVGPMRFARGLLASRSCSVVLLVLR